MKSILAAAFFAGVCVPQAGSAAEKCDLAPAIAAVTDFLLTEPAKPSRFWRDYEGSDAAFLKIRYLDLDPAATRTLLDGLEQRAKPPERMRELSLALATPAGRAAALSRLATDDDTGISLVLFSGSVVRASIFDDGGAALIGALAALRDADAQRFGKAAFALDQIAVSIADLPDKTKVDLAGVAEKAGLWQLAYVVLAQMQDLHELVALLKRMPEAEFRERPESLDEKRKSLLRQAVSRADSRAIPLDATKQPFEVLAIIGGRPMARAWQVLAPLALRSPEMQFLNTLLNQTGEFKLATEVAPALLADIDAGKLDPIKSPDAIVSAMIERVDAVLGREQRERHLGSFDISPAYGGKGEKASAVVDAAIARDALAPLVREETTTMPARPAALTREFDWDRWLRVATALSKQLPASEDDRLIGASLQTGAAHWGEALDSLKQAADWQFSRSSAYELMRRLDRRCLELLQPIAPYYQHLYRLDGR